MKDVHHMSIHELKDYIKEPQLWEISPEYQSIVCQRVVAYPIAPREALAILEVCGRLISMGFKVEHIIDRITSGFKSGINEYDQD